MHWISKVVKATVGPQKGEQTFSMSGTWQEKTNYIHDVTFSTVFAEDFKKVLWS